MFDIAKTILIVLVVVSTVYFLTKNMRRALQVATGLGLVEAFNILYDMVLWPMIQGKYGFIGFVGLTIGATILNFSLLKLYQKSKNDWLGVEEFEKLQAHSHALKARHAESTNHFERFALVIPAHTLRAITFMLEKKWFAFLYFSIIMDSFITTAFLKSQTDAGRRGELTTHDYQIFFLSTIVSCIGWGVLSQLLIIPSFSYLLNLLF